MLADELKKQIESGYAAWEKQHSKDLVEITSRKIRSWGKVEVLCHGRVQRTNFCNCLPTCLPCDKMYLIKWVEENGFRYRESCNSHGAPTIVWTL